MELVHRSTSAVFLGDCVVKRGHRLGWPARPQYGDSWRRCVRPESGGGHLPRESARGPHADGPLNARFALLEIWRSEVAARKRKRRRRTLVDGINIVHTNVCASLRSARGGRR